MTDYHKTVQYQLRISSYLRDQIKESAKKNNRSMNEDIRVRLEDSFMTDEAYEHIDSIKNNSKNVRVFDIGNGVRRIVYGKMLDVFDIDYTMDLNTIQRELEQAVFAMQSSKDLGKFLKIPNKKIKVYKGGHHIDIVEDGVGTLNWLVIENVPTTIKSINSY